MKREFHHALVIGASSGIGEALARRLAAADCRVVMVARRRDELERIAAEINDLCGEERAFPLVHDVRDRDEVPRLFEQVPRTLGGLDLVVYASGVLHKVGFEEYDTAKDAHTFEVNLLGAVAWLNAAAARFQRLGGGTIVGIGSIAGDRGRSGSPAYNTSKGALAIYLETLRNRIARRGTKVVTIKPGYVETPMTAGAKMFWEVSADRAAQIILAKARRGVVCAYVPARWRLVSWVIRSIPSFLFRRLKV
ncbi:MAG: SDR family NAD(P)-dependent oxidoreductase [Acidobacteria bacterium]|nr:SDR family NAD(P)-dependent oxidoreductase [Acidobacteriota bacterium]